MKPPTVLLLSLNPASGLCDSLRDLLSAALSNASIEQRFFAHPEPALLHREISKAILGPDPELIFLIFQAGLLDKATALIQAIKRERLLAPIVAIVDAADPDALLQLLKAGASDFITPPLKAIDILPRVWRLLDQHLRDAPPDFSVREHPGLKQIVGQSPALIAEIRKFPMLARYDASVLLLGETGAGKELCARAIHYLSPRASKPFVPVNCGAIPVELVENELFGHEREAFTGAATSRTGLIAEADGGTLFLDEIDCLPLAAQVKMLRFLQEKEYRPLGSIRMRQADVRVMAATNIDLEEAVRNRRIRQDLYYRQNVIPLILPPLRERRDDIPLLARHFLSKWAIKFDKHASDLSSGAIDRLMGYDWPGNVRELEHIVERAVVLSEQMVIREDEICLPRSEQGPREASFQQTKARVIAQFEISYLEGLLLVHQGNITRAAEAARKDRRAFRQLIRKHKIDVQSFKLGA